MRVCTLVYLVCYCWFPQFLFPSLLLFSSIIDTGRASTPCNKTDSYCKKTRFSWSHHARYVFQSGYHGLGVKTLVYHQSSGIHCISLVFYHLNLVWGAKWHGQYVQGSELETLSEQEINETSNWWLCNPFLQCLGDLRNDLYLTFHSGEFEKGMSHI